ncbi:MAG: EAL domain-containing protein [Eubacterium sp.]|nr:EAL domain-containing protein [Eubacterium sp.]
MYIFASIISALILVLVICLIRTFKSKKPIAKETRQLLISALIPIVSNLVVVFSSNYQLSGICYFLYFSSTDWMLAFMIRFTCKYCGYEYRKTLKERLVGTFCGLDTLIMVFNPFFHHVFSSEEVLFGNGHLYYNYVSEWYHYIHLGLSYVLAAVCLVLLLIRFIKSSSIYRERYFVMIMSVLVVAGWELYYILNPNVLEYSMVGYGSMAVLIYYFALEYKPFVATYRLLSEVVGNISEGIVFFDENNICIFANNKAKEMLGYGQDQIEGAWKDIMMMTAGDEFDFEDITREGYFQCVRNITKEEGERITYEIEYQQVLDKKEKYTGAFVALKDRTEEQKKLDEERFVATHDRLTGLYNADYLYSRVEKTLKENPNQRYIVVTSDIKGFKMVNDIYGTRTGDDILIKIARLIEGYASKDTIYGRISNDKFGLIMRRERYRESLFSEDMVKATTSNPDMFYPIIIHVGVYEVTDRRIPVSVMFDRAFMALSTIKNDMQKRVAYYDSNLREDMLWEQRVAGSIDAGLSTQQIIPYMQAQVDVDGNIQGVELLARWMHPTEGFLKPRRFLPTLEKNGYVVKLDQYMWERACSIIKKWESEGWEDLYISVNISPVDFFFIDVVESFKSLVELYEVDPKKLRLEITENAMMYNSGHRIESIERLREAGFLVEMDDFGNGFSSLNMLKDTPIDVIKIDMAFLDETKNPKRAKQILESMIALAKKLEIPVITEGVETAEQVQYLTEMGCDMFQGYYFAKAFPMEEFEDRYLRSGEKLIIANGGNDVLY